jgi:hypothetical protein
MVKAALFAALTVTSVIGASVASAQTAPASSTPLSNRSQVFQAPPHVQTPAPGTGRTPAFTLFGLPAYIRAPVAAPYANSAYENFAGQPQRSSDSLFVDSMRGQ